MAGCHVVARVPVPLCVSVAMHVAQEGVVIVVRKETHGREDRINFQTLVHLTDDPLPNVTDYTIILFTNTILL